MRRLLLAAGCGTGTDGKPVAPTSPVPAGLEIVMGGTNVRDPQAGRLLTVPEQGRPPAAMTPPARRQNSVGRNPSALTMRAVPPSTWIR